MAREAGVSKWGWFDADAFYAALDGVRHRRKLNWRQVAAEPGVSASTRTRMAQGKRPDVDGLAALVAWSGLDADTYLRASGDGEERPEQEPLAMISPYLRADRNLSADAASALEQVIKITYDQLRHKD